MPKTVTPPDASDTRLCRHCGRAANRHGKMVGTCFRAGKALRTRFEAARTTKKPPSTGG